MNKNKLLYGAKVIYDPINTLNVLRVPYHQDYMYILDKHGEEKTVNYIEIEGINRTLTLKFYFYE